MNMNDNKPRLLKMLADARIRPSFQRLAILECVTSSHCHPTAEEIYSSLVEENPMLSRTTVFSNLRLLAEKGLINDIDIVSDSTRYDTAVDPRHAHFMCRRCRRIFDVPFDMPAPQVPGGFHCDNVNVYFKGMCPECRAKGNSDGGAPETGEILLKK